MRITVLLIFFISHLIFIPSVFGEGFTLSCPRDFTGEYPIKFKFSEDKKTSWILENDNWAKLKVKQTEMYYYLSGWGYNRECTEWDDSKKKKIETHKFRVKSAYIIDRNTLRLYKKVEEGVDMSDKCNTDWNRNYYIVPKGKVLEGFSKPCTVSKIQF